jgi:two-component system response regulator DegU
MWPFSKLLSKLSATNPLDSLSNREGQVLKLLANGDSNKAIANSLGISERTVKNHCSNIYRVLKVQNRVQAAKTFWHIK